jgi:hypothetical protein
MRDRDDQHNDQRELEIARRFHNLAQHEVRQPEIFDAQFTHHPRDGRIPESGHDDRDQPCENTAEFHNQCSSTSIRGNPLNP